MATKPAAAYSGNDAVMDARNLAALLDVAVTEGCDMDHGGLSEEQTKAMDRIHSILWVSREIAERLTAGVFNSMKGA